MKIKIREKEKIVAWIIAGFFIIMGILVMLKSMWATINASETVPAVEALPQTDRVVVHFIEVTRPTEPLVEDTEFIDSVEPTEAIEVIETVEKVEKVPAKSESKNKTESKTEAETQPEGETVAPQETEPQAEDETEPEQESEPELRSLGRFKLTAYCACSKCCGKSDGITASGTKAKQGRTIAVDPKQIPYGTKVVINGHTYVAEDCGGGIRKNCIDVFFDSHKEAENFGRQYAEVFVYVG